MEKDRESHFEDARTPRTTLHGCEGCKPRILAKFVDGVRAAATEGPALQVLKTLAALLVFA